MSNTSLWALAVNLRTRIGGWGGSEREGLEALLLDGFLTKASPPTYTVSFYLSLGDRPAASLLTSGQNVSCLLQVFFQATSPGYVTDQIQMQQNV